MANSSSFQLRMAESVLNKQPSRLAPNHNGNKRVFNSGKKHKWKQAQLSSVVSTNDMWHFLLVENHHFASNLQVDATVAFLTTQLAEAQHTPLLASSCPVCSAPSRLRES